MLNRCRSLSRTAFAGLLICPGRVRRQGARQGGVASAAAGVVAKVEARDVPVEVRAPVDLRPLAQADVGLQDARLPGRRPRRSRRSREARASSWRWSVPAICPISSPRRAARWRRRSRRARAGAHQLRARQASSRRRRSSRSRSCSRRRAGSRPPRPRRRPPQGADRRAGDAPRRDAHRVAARRASSRSAGSIRARWSARRAAARSSPWRASTCCASSSPSTSASCAGVQRRSGRARRARRAARARPSRARSCGSRPRSIPATRTLDAEVQLDNAAGELRPGHVRARRDRRRDAPAGRRRARRRGAVSPTGKRYVFVLIGGDKVAPARARPVGVDGGDWFEVTKGVARRRRGRDGGHRRRCPTASTVRARARSVDAVRRDGGRPRDARRHGALEDAAHVADPARASQPGPHPDDVADDHGARLRVAAPAQRRSLPRHRRPGHPRRDLLYGRRPRRHREDASPQPIERAVGASPGVDRVESQSQQGVLVGQRLVQLRRQPGQRAVRGVSSAWRRS